jgi:hypothetical protein
VTDFAQIAKEVVESNGLNLEDCIRVDRTINFTYADLIGHLSAMPKTHDIVIASLLDIDGDYVGMYHYLNYLAETVIKTITRNGSVLLGGSDNIIQ